MSIADPAPLSRTFMRTTLCELIQKRPNRPLVDRELTLFEMLDDPIVIRVMRRDGVACPEVMKLFTARNRECLCRAA
jgi:hypothetical protein